MGDRPVLWAALSRKELNSQAVRVPCGSGFSREESNAVHGTGCAGVRG
ncbi:integral membrane protein TerC [Pseudomonas plecoglossicida]|nr:integral membrane protein TerC [Pseudomonas plecoglossicida]